MGIQGTMSWLRGKKERTVAQGLSFTEDLMMGDHAVSQSRRALADIVDFFGRESFSIPQHTRDAFQARCAGLQDYLLGGSAPAEIHRELADVALSDPLPIYPNSPNLTDTVEFLFRRRRAEAEFVRSTLPSLKSAFLRLVERVRASVQEDLQEDDELREVFQTLGQAVSSDDVTELRHVAEKAVDTVTRQLDARKARSQSQLQAMGEQIKSLREKLLETEAQSVTDPLTRLLNRRGLQARLEQELMVSRLTGEPLSVGMVDIDYFKSVNDRFGHGVGDDALVFVSDKLVETFKEKSTLLARHGGEEFLVALPNHTEWGARKRLEIFRERLAAAPMQLDDGRRLTITASIGVASLAGEIDAVQLLERADRALYGAKHRGRNQVARWSKLPLEPPSSA